MAELTPWNSEWEKFALENYAAGNSHTTVARMLNEKFGTNFKRGAVCGKIHRLQKAKGKSGRKKPSALRTF